jgi:hypothetical protein
MTLVSVSLSFWASWAMAAGLGLRPDQTQEIEEGLASDEMANHYAQ